MDKPKSSKFFKIYSNNRTYKVFLEDVSVIYKVSTKRTPRLIPDFESKLL